MKNSILAVLMAWLVVSGLATRAVAADQSTMVHVGNNRLEYKAAANGDRIPDFSYCQAWNVGCS